MNQKMVVDLFNGFVKDCNPYIAYYEVIQHIIAQPRKNIKDLLLALQERFEIHISEKEEAQ